MLESCLKLSSRVFGANQGNCGLQSGRCVEFFLTMVGFVPSLVAPTGVEEI